MKQKISLIVATLIMILPLAVYAVFKAPKDSAALASVKDMPVVMEFSSPMCSECMKLKKILEIVEPNYENKIFFKKINAVKMDKETQKLVKKYNVVVVPTTVFIEKNGNVLARTEGAIHQKTFEYYLDKLLDK